MSLVRRQPSSDGTSLSLLRGIGSASFSVTGAPIKKDAEIIREIADNSIFFICFN